MAESRESPTLLAAVAFGLILVLAIVLFAVSAWLEGVGEVLRSDPAAWWSRLDRQAALDAISSAAEVVAGVLAVAITVVAIVVELAANRYTPKISNLFVRHPTNAMVMGFFVLTTIQCVWVSSSLGRPVPEGALIPYASLGLCMGMVTLCLLLLLPYFAFVFHFLSPRSIVRRIQRQALRCFERARLQQRPALLQQAVEAIEELVDIGRSARDQSDLGIAMESVNALRDLVLAYEEPRGGVEKLAMVEMLARDTDFISLDPGVRDDLIEQGLWLQAKVLRQYHALFSESLGRAREISHLISLNTVRIGASAVPGRPSLLALCVQFFNSYLRAAINAGDLRTSYYVLHQYRSLSEEALRKGAEGAALEIAGHFRFYGLLGYQQGQPFLLEVAAYDLAHLVEFALTEAPAVVDPLLDLFLRVDEEGESREQETRLRGVRRAQVQLATLFLVRGDQARARRIFDDMRYERPERLASVREELLAETRLQYWEFTDRGVNFSYLPPEQRQRVDDFFAWFDATAPDALVPPASRRFSVESEPAPDSQRL
jgi:hypothetical protein